MGKQLRRMVLRVAARGWCVGKRLAGVRCFSTPVQGDSVRDREIEFYSSLDDWWAEDGPQEQLHKFNKLRLNFIRKHLLRSTGRGVNAIRDANALDIGCGAGILSEGLGRLGVNSVTGIDPTPRCVEMAEAHLQVGTAELQQRVQYRNMSVEELIDEHEEPPQFDLVCCSEVIEHVHDQRTFVHKCAELVKPGGFFFLSSIARTPEAWVSNILLGEYVLGIVPKGTHEWEFLIDQKTVEQHLDEVGCTTVAAKGAAVVNPFTLEMGEIPYLRGNYLMMARKTSETKN